VPGTTITIDSEQRDGLYELVRNHIGSVGDLFDALEREKDFAKAEQLGLEFAEDFRLLQDLGWAEDDGREGVELTMSPHDLMEVLQRLHGEAGMVLGDTEESAEDAETKRRFRQGYDTCKRVLAAIDPRAGQAA
jgi:hypothetical protein